MTTGQRVCPVCALDGEIVATPSPWARLRGWLSHGQASSPTMRCAAGHEWPAGSTATLAFRGRRGSRLWGLPGRVVRVLLNHRTAEPVPIFWLGAAVVGVLIGVLLDVTVGVSWLLVVAVWLLLIWLVFLATALRPLGRDNLWVDLVRAVNPKRANRLEDDQLARLVKAAPGPIYGLSEWAHQRSLGGHGRSA